VRGTLSKFTGKVSKLGLTGLSKIKVAKHVRIDGNLGISYFFPHLEYRGMVVIWPVGIMKCGGGERVRGINNLKIMGPFVREAWYLAKIRGSNGSLNERVPGSSNFTIIRAG